MIKRPISVTILACLLIAIGAIGIAYHFTEFRSTPAGESVLILFVRLLAIVCGAFLLRGRDWARWLTMAWIAFHVGLSYFDSTAQMAFHAVVLLIFAAALFNSAANRYFRPPTEESRKLTESP